MRNRSRTIYHIIGWIAFFAIPFLFFLPVESLFLKSPFVLLEIFIIDLLCIAFYYFNYSVGVPHLFFQKRYWLYVLSLCCWLLAMIITRFKMDMYPAPPTAKGGFVGTTGVIVFRFVVIGVISFGERTFDRLKKTEEAKLKTELSFLKAQINPHFLFNTLNSIYTLIIKKSDEAADAVVKLSGIMRYVISEAEHDLVALDKEITYVSNYIDLQKMRLTRDIEIVFEVRGDLLGRRIIPLILLPLIENAFKHGVSVEESSSIFIEIIVQNDQLILTVKNRKVRTHVPEKENTGTGIANVRHRLQLIYPDQHSLKISSEDKYYTAILNIGLS